jgi:hypothetical protein
LTQSSWSTAVKTAEQEHEALMTSLKAQGVTDPAAYATSEHGLGLDLALDARTREAVQRALPSLINEPVAGLRGRRLEAEDFDRLVVGDPVRDVLMWMNDPAGCAQRWSGKTYDGFLVRKDLVRKYARQYPVPTYVVEFLLGRYCASVNEAEIAEGLAIVEQQLKDRTVRTGEEELFKARAKEDGEVRIIDIVKARLDPKNDCYVAELPSLALRDVRISSQLVTDNERMLTDGFFAEVTLGYDGVIAQEQGGRPFSIQSLRPIQMSKADVLDVYGKGRAAFTTQEWIDFLIRSIGLEPSALSERAKKVTLLRMVPFVERNYNLVELGFPLTPT